MPVRRPILAAAAASLLLLSGCAAPMAPEQPVSTLPRAPFVLVTGLSVERLDTAPAVAAAKHFSGAPVVDTAREQSVLDTAAALAADLGTDAEYVRAVFTDQITASKDVQTRLLDEWAAGAAAAPTTAPDLATEVRPVLDSITPQLVAALGVVAAYRDDPGCGAALTAASEEAARLRPALQTALAHICD